MTIKVLYMVITFLREKIPELIINHFYHNFYTGDRRTLHIFFTDYFYIMNTTWCLSDYHHFLVSSLGFYWPPVKRLLYSLFSSPIFCKFVLHAFMYLSFFHTQMQLLYSKHLQWCTFIWCICSILSDF